ncbi:ABC transporter substrate-binding protein [Aldersonia sp. NBC_00410]|uniref:ABC transporter substrate-binding protein n=1 Tax=Aldersonia sp. NBC_00410 TaxID=2975954 RepID=UPI002254CC4F|nr:ABC transporter substrate-binding protein [Aldersonia sp. NBC_00410]MCX5045240.1 ABC transporter substrate-binding protein [Aldersonia sp. NBC_00410]
MAPSRHRRTAGDLAIGVAGCGSDDDSDDASGGGTTVVITHNLGTTEFDATPERVVALGDQWLDAAESLGVEPVGYAAAASVLTGGKPAPWEPASLADATVINVGGDIVEQIAALNPDLILVPNFLIDQPKYDKLSQLAPTVGALTPAQVDPWDKQVQTLGMILPPEVVAAAGGQGRMGVSPERVGELNSQFLVTSTMPGMEGAYEKLPGYGELPSVQNGSVTNLDIMAVTGLNTPTPLSVPYVLNLLEPGLVKAAAAT